MKRYTLICLVLILWTVSFAQNKIEPNWESIDARPIPEWFSDAKFGIFI
ncbi:MAG: hypothetical protein HOC82_12280, partial [Bacteroidetes bacterium]|nr:hypothetical protein [Bacteroidota bacterium]